MPQYTANNLSVTSQPTISVLSIWNWIIFQQRSPVSPVFNWQLQWSSYRKGFGNIDSNFWLGLKRLHLLTSSASYQLRIEMKQTSTGLWISAEYTYFAIDDETTNKYRLHVGG
jgi:ficolin